MFFMLPIIAKVILSMTHYQQVARATLPTEQ